MASVAQAFPAPSGLTYKAKRTKELARIRKVEPTIFRPILHGLVPIAANNQGAVLAFRPAQGSPEGLQP